MMVNCSSPFANRLIRYSRAMMASKFCITPFHCWLRMLTSCFNSISGLPVTWVKNVAATLSKNCRTRACGHRMSSEISNTGKRPENADESAEGKCDLAEAGDIDRRKSSETRHLQQKAIPE